MRLLAVAALVLVSAPAFSQQSAPVTAAAADEKPICRRIAITGSNFTKRECHTKAEWKAMRERDEANAERALDNRAPRTGSGQ